MRLLRRIRRALVELFGRSRWEREADEELRAFVDMSVADRDRKCLGVKGTTEWYGVDLDSI